MITPTLAEAKRLSEEYTVIPIAMELYSDTKTSIEILKNIREKSSNFYILESVKNSDTWGRYTFLGYDPTLTIRGIDRSTTIQKGLVKETTVGDPLSEIRKILSDYKSPRISSLPPFTGGLVGYFSYECIQYFEPSLNLKSKDEEGFNDYQFMLMDKVIAIDHFKQKIYLIVNISAKDVENSYIRGVTRLKDMESLVLTHTAHTVDLPECGDFTPLFTEQEYCEKVEKVKEHIAEGDIFQGVISNRLTAPFKGDLLEVYRNLRTANPSPYMVYFHFDDLEIAGASPETLVSLKDGKVSTYPLAGTCPRGATEKEDEMLIKNLLENEKELSEHDMLVDLGRNDIGKVSKFGSVEVEEYRGIKKFSHVSHIASKVSGAIAENMDALDAISAMLPAGTLSGAPKKRACEIIDEIEGIKRGLYGGALGYIDFAGNMDMCIGIRMTVKKNNKVFVQSGGGIVAESDPKAEYQESKNKAQAVINALQAGKAV